MSYPDPINLATDVWMVPCKIDPSSKSYKPLLKPLHSTVTFPQKITELQWKLEEDSLLLQRAMSYGAKNWSSVAKEINTKIHNTLPVRNGKQCRERWFNKVNPDLLTTTWTEDEDRIILEKHMEFGNKWKEIANFLQGRNENQVKNRCKSLKKKAAKMLKHSLKVKHSKKGLNKSAFFNVPYLFKDIPQTLPLKVEDKTQDEPEAASFVFKEFGRYSIESMNSNRPEDETISLRISSLTSDPDLQSSLGLKNVYNWPGKLDFDNLYNSFQETEKTDLDNYFNTYFKAPETEVWNFEADSFTPCYFRAFNQCESEILEKKQEMEAAKGLLNIGGIYTGGNFETTEMFNKKK